MRTDWKDDIFEGERRIYNIVDSPDGNGKNIIDVTNYTQNGDIFGARQINEIGEEVNKIQAIRMIKLTGAGWSTTAPYTQTVSVTGIKATDLPIPLLDTSAALNYNSEKLMRKQYGWIGYYDTADESITFTAKYRKPTVDLAIGLKGVD